MATGIRRNVVARGFRGSPRPLPCAAVLALLILFMSSAALAQDENSDGLIYDRVIRRLVNDRQLKTNALKVTVEDAVVTVEGVVQNEKLRIRVDRVVKKVKGVKKVNNQVTVQR